MPVCCSPSDEVSSRTGVSALSPTSSAAGNNVNFKRGIQYRTTISGSTVKDRRPNAAPTRTGTFAVPPDSNDVSSVSHGSGSGGGRGLSFFDKLTSKFSRRYVVCGLRCRAICLATETSSYLCWYFGFALYWYAENLRRTVYEFVLSGNWQHRI